MSNLDVFGDNLPACKSHPEALGRRFGDLWRCSECGEPVDYCTATLGRKECYLRAGHGGLFHASFTGSRWPTGAAEAISPMANKEQS